MNKKVITITGKRGSGKSRLCLNLLNEADSKDRISSGIISPSDYTDLLKTAFYTMDVRTREKRICGKRTEPDQGTIGCWQMDAETLEWGNSLIRNSCPCDILFIDELGPLEFIKHKGYTAAFDVLQNGIYKTAYVVVRPECIPAFKTVIHDFDLINAEEDLCTTGLRI